MGEFSIWHMILLFVIVLIIFGPKNLPKVGQALGKGIREFKDAARGLTSEIEEDERRAAARREIQNQPAPAPPVNTQPVQPQPVVEPVKRTETAGIYVDENQNSGGTPTV